MPEIATDACMGCGLCVKACHPGALEMVWDFATLVRADDCESCGECMEVCPHGVIRMNWIPMSGNAEIGKWRDQPARAPTQSKSRFWDLLARATGSTTAGE
jgi:ferredoxin